MVDFGTQAHLNDEKLTKTADGIAFGTQPQKQQRTHVFGTQGDTKRMGDGCEATIGSGNNGNSSRNNVKVHVSSAGGNGIPVPGVTESKQFQRAPEAKITT